MKKIFKTVKILIIILALALPYLPIMVSPAKAATNSLMILDSNFDNAGTMSTTDIQAFLNKFPNSCIKNYTDEYPNDYWSYGGPVSAATIIRRASDLWGINPQVMLTKLEQEENLVTGSSGCALFRYVSAVGFNCPGPTRNAVFRGTPLVTCVQSDQNMGFSRQVSKGAWLLKWAKERANGNLSWSSDDPSIYYYGPMTQGNRRRSGSSPLIYFDGYWNGTYISSGGTASLYNYTPFFNQSFSTIYQNFFGYDPSTILNPYHSESLFRIFLPWNGEHFYTKSFYELQQVQKSGGIFDGVVYLTPNYAGSVPVYRFWNTNGKHFYTSNENEKNYVTNVLKYKYEGIAYYVQPTQVPATIPVYRLWQPSTGNYLFTSSTYERDTASRLGYRYEGIPFYAY